MEAKVVWAEGIYLSQQTLQQFEAHHVEQYRCLALVGCEANWGLLKLKIDESALQLRQFRVLDLTCIFPHGLYVQFNADHGELSYQIENSEVVNLYCHLARNDKINDIVAYPNPKGMAAWQAEFTVLMDRFDKNRHQEVMLAQPKLFLSHSPLAGYYNLQIAKLVTDQDSSVGLDLTFIPPTISSMLPAMQLILKSCQLEILDLRQRLQGYCQHKMSDHSQLLLMHYHINKACCEFSDMLLNQLHPQHIYKYLRSFIAGFSLSGCAPQLPPYRYQHEDLYATFASCYQLLQNINQSFILSSDTIIHFNKTSSCIYLSEIIDENTLQQQKALLRLPASADVNAIIKRIKIADNESIESIVKASMSGIPVVKFEDISWQRQFNFQYHFYALHEQHPLWQRVKKSQRLALYIPEECQGINLEVIFKEL